MPEGATLCPNCGQAFSAPASVSRPPLMEAPTAYPAAITYAAVPAYQVPTAIPRAEYAGFWLRFLALVIDNIVIGLGFFLIVIPLIFLTGLRNVLQNFHPDEEMGDMGFFVLIGLIFAAATASVVLTWLYHAWCESSEWQATLGKKVLGLVVTDMDSQRVSFGRASGRHFAKILTNMIPAFIGYLMAAFTGKKQALHDLIAGCLVLKSKA